MAKEGRALIVVLKLFYSINEKKHLFVMMIRNWHAISKIIPEDTRNKKVKVSFLMCLFEFLWTS